MENQLELMNEMDRKFRIGDEVEGEILSITNDVVVISLIGYKSDGVIPFKELTSAEKLEEVLSNIKVGDIIKAKVIKLKNEDNYVVLSRLEFEKDEALGYLEKVYENKEELTIKVTAAKEKGLVAYYNGVKIRKSKTGYESVKTIYICEDCSNCNYKSQCIKVNNSKIPLEKRTKKFETSKNLIVKGKNI